MRCAILAVSPRGAALSGIVLDALDGNGEIYVNEKYIGAAPDGAKPYGRLSEYVGEIFHRYDALVFISAAGIALRMIAPHLVSKLEDPAVLVMDERGRHVISLLSGHVGGANLLTRQLAESIGGEAVITTATDVEGTLAPDAIAGSLALRPWPKAGIERFNSGLLQGEFIRYYVDPRLPLAEIYCRKLKGYGIAAELLQGEELPPEGLRVLVTGEPGEFKENLLYLMPRRLIAGIGCRRGISEELLRDALESACRRIGWEISAVALLASAEVKRDEEGLLAIARNLGKEIRFFPSEILEEQILRYHLRESSFVKEQIGAGNVCEAAALACCAEGGRVALPKTKFERATVALVWEK